MVRDRLKASSFAAEARGRVIITGGASQLTGLPELASHIFGRPVRIGRPLGIAGLPEAAKGAAFAVATGLLVYPHRVPGEKDAPDRVPVQGAQQQPVRAQRTGHRLPAARQPKLSGLGGQQSRRLLAAGRIHGREVQLDLPGLQPVSREQPAPRAESQLPT